MRPPRLALAEAFGECDGQIVVEMAVVAPVMIVTAIIVLNLMLFLEAAACFDRIVPDTIMAVAVSPPASTQGTSQEHEIVQALERSMEGIPNVDISVRAVPCWSWEGDGVGFSFAPHLTRYACTLTYRPWPTSLSVAGVEAGIPLELTHGRTFTVDRYRSGIVF